MKFKNILVCGLILTSLAGGAVTAFAEEKNNKMHTTDDERIYYEDNEARQSFEQKNSNYGEREQRRFNGRNRCC